MFFKGQIQVRKADESVVRRKEKCFIFWTLFSARIKRVNKRIKLHSSGIQLWENSSAMQNS